MISEVWIYSLIRIVGVFIASCSQIMLKLAADRQYSSRMGEYLNIRVIIAYGLFAVGAGLNLYILRYMPLSLAVILETTGYIFVAILGFSFLKESLSKRQVVGIILIVVGIVVFSI